MLRMLGPAERSFVWCVDLEKSLGNAISALHCRFSCNRDYNASRNVFIVGMEQPPVVPIVPTLLHHIFVMQVLAMKWEAALVGMR